MPEIHHISLDLWMTLIRTHPEFKKKRAELFCRFFSVPDLDETEKTIRKIDLAVNHINETTGGNVDSLEMYLLVLHLLKDDAKTTTIDALTDFYTDSEKLFFDYMPIGVDDSVEDGLKMLEGKGITMNILSNTGFINGRILRKYLETVNWERYFTFQVYSDETNYSKPHPLMFDAVWLGLQKNNTGELSVHKNNILHFGDNPTADVDGAERYGFQAALYQPGQASFYQQIKNVLHETSVRTASDT